MPIETVEVIPYALPFREPYVTARGTLTEREMVLVRLRDEEGAVGLGEAVPLSLRTAKSLEQVVAELRAWAERPDGGDLPGSAPARCAVETALLDLTARRKGVPAWSVLGAATAEPVRCNATLAAGEPQAVARSAADWAAAGFDAFKLKVGVPKDLDQVRAVRGALGGAAELRVDANASWGPAQALRSLEAMAAEGVSLAEQPCATLEDMARVARRVEMTIAADESVTEVADAQRASQLGACDLATVKLSKVGGPAAAVAISAVIPAYLSSALDGPVGIAAAAHTAQILREQGNDAGIAHGLATQRLFAETIAAVECELRGDLLHLPGGPGLGVEIDDAALQRHRL